MTANYCLHDRVLHHARQREFANSLIQQRIELGPNLIFLGTGDMAIRAFVIALADIDETSDDPYHNRRMLMWKRSVRVCRWNWSRQLLPLHRLRKCTGSAFNIGVRIEARRFRIARGSPKGFTKLGGSGDYLTRHFCPEYGSPLYTSSPRHPDVVYVKAGCLDDPTVVKPAHQIWTKSKVGWATIDPSLPGFPTGAEW